MMLSDEVLGRAVDIMLGAFFIFLTVPIVAIAAIAVKFENPGASVLFRQTLFDCHGRPFSIIKLRTMVPEAEKLKSDLIALSPDKGPGFNMPVDPRVTRVGHWLRRNYIDEIPLFLAVLKGDMSIAWGRGHRHHRPE